MISVPLVSTRSESLTRIPKRMSTSGRTLLPDRKGIDWAKALKSSPRARHTFEGAQRIPEAVLALWSQWKRTGLVDKSTGSAYAVAYVNQTPVGDSRAACQIVQEW